MTKKKKKKRSAYEESDSEEENDFYYRAQASDVEVLNVEGDVMNRTALPLFVREKRRIMWLMMIKRTWSIKEKSVKRMKKERMKMR